MNEILFSIYGDILAPLTNPDFLLKKFEDQHHARVQIEPMRWEEAWSKLLDFALHGGGPHISIIGAIWTRSLQSMNTLHPFSSQEITSLGGTNAFFPSTWENALLSPANQSWAVPFNAYTYLLLYRRDLLEKAGIDDSKAFTSPVALLATLERLKGAGVSSPIILPSGEPFLARNNIVSSWIWGAGGDYITEMANRSCSPRMRHLTGFVISSSYIATLIPAIMASPKRNASAVLQLEEQLC